eukprot:m.185686 g.185686  ORF g.185686 m.185686 type:complete len:621 (+) comp21585_c0_seq1:2967-4829(+)
MNVFFFLCFQKTSVSLHFFAFLQTESAANLLQNSGSFLCTVRPRLRAVLVAGAAEQAHKQVHQQSIESFAVTGQLLKLLGFLGGLLHHTGRQPGQLGNVETVAAISRALLQLVQKENIGHCVVFGSWCLVEGHVVVVDVAGEGLGQGSQGWVVCHKQRHASHLGNQMVEGGVGHGHTVVCAGAAPQLVHNHQRLCRGVAHDLGCFLQLHHESALLFVDVVRCSHSGVHSIENAQLGFFRWHKAAALCHDCDQCHLADVRALATHVGPCDDHAALLCTAEGSVVGHKLTGCQQWLDYGVPALPNVHLWSAGHEGRANVVRLCGHNCKRAQAIQCGQMPHHHPEVLVLLNEIVQIALPGLVCLDFHLFSAACNLIQMCNDGVIVIARHRLGGSNLDEGGRQRAFESNRKFHQVFHSIHSSVGEGRLFQLFSQKLQMSVQSRLHILNLILECKYLRDISPVHEQLGLGIGFGSVGIETLAHMAHVTQQVWGILEKLQQERASERLQRRVPVPHSKVSHTLERIHRLDKLQGRALFVVHAANVSLQVRQLGQQRLQVFDTRVTYLTNVTHPFQPGFNFVNVEQGVRQPFAQLPAPAGRHCVVHHPKQRPLFCTIGKIGKHFQIA